MKAIVLTSVIALTAASTASANVFGQLVFPPADMVIEKPIETDRKAVKIAG
ncbi:MAG: hypothetical protein AAF429_05140 [Pseudomonadota bacterium]